MSSEVVVQGNRAIIQTGGYNLRAIRHLERLDAEANHIRFELSDAVSSGGRVDLDLGVQGSVVNEKGRV